MAKETYFVFIIQAYEEREGDILKDLCVIEVIAETADKAVERAKTIITKKEYRVKDVIEKYV